ncbi:hypothetical protein MKX01_035322 [Papaver californicum]|nr:hypothetical protein MKX01_035322 [Papaver californicum]
MLQSMNVFHQTTRPKLLYSSSSCHGRRIQHKPPVLVSFPAKLKLGSVLFALPRDNEEFSSDNEEFSSDNEEFLSDNEEQENHKHEEHRGALISSDNGEYVVREATLYVEFWASAWLKAEGFYEDQSQDRFASSLKKKQAEQEFNVIKRRCKERTIQPYIKSQRYVIISNVTVAQSARRMGIGSSMLKFAIESAKENAARRKTNATNNLVFDVSRIKQVFLHVRRDNKPALALYEKMGFEILAKATTPHMEEHNLYLCSLNLQEKLQGTLQQLE